MNSINNLKFNELEILDVLNHLWSKRTVFMYAALFLFLISSAIAMLLPKKWVSDSLVIEVGGSESSQSASAGMLAELTGINIGSQRGRVLDLIKRRLVTKDFYKHMIQDPEFYTQLIAVKSFDEELNKNIYDSQLYDVENALWIKEPSFYEGHQKFLKTARAGFLDDKTANFLIIRAEHVSPISAQFIVQSLVREINELKRAEDILDADNTLNYLQSELRSTNQISIKAAINGLIENQVKTKTFANVKTNYLIKPLDQAYIPERRSKPNRKSFVLSITSFGLFLLAIFYSLQAVFRNTKGR